MDHLEAPGLLQCQQSHFEFLGTKISPAFKGLLFSTSPTVIRLQQEESTDYAHDETPLYQCTFSEISNPTPRLVGTGVASTQAVAPHQRTLKCSSPT